VGGRPEARSELAEVPGGSRRGRSYEGAHRITVKCQTMLYSSAHKPNRREHRYGSEVHCRWKQLNQFQSRYRVQLSGIGAADMLDIVVAAKISDSRPPLHQHLPTLRLFLLMFGRASFCGPFEQVQTSKLSAESRRALDYASSTQSTVAVRVGAFFRGLSRIVRRRKSSLM
jgi:hypothetical protein